MQPTTFWFAIVLKAHCGQLTTRHFLVFLMVGLYQARGFRAKPHRQLWEHSAPRASQVTPGPCGEDHEHHATGTDGTRQAGYFLLWPTIRL